MSVSVTFRFTLCIVTVRMGSVPILPVKRTITIGTMLKFNGDGHGHGDGDGMCKQTFTALPSSYFFLTACCRCCIFSRPEGEARYCKNTAGNGCHLPQPPVRMFYLLHVVPSYTALFNMIQLLKFRFF